MNKDLKILMTSSDKTGCGMLRTQLPATFLQQTFPWTQFRLGFPPNDPIINEADVVVLQRATHEFFVDWIPKAKENGKRIIFDIDDSLWDIPSANLAHRYYPTKELKKLEKVIKLCDHITVSTEPLKGRIKDIFNREDVTVIPNMMFDIEFEKPKNEKIRIGWAGSYTHNGDFDKHLVNTLRGIVKKYPQVELYTFGFTPQFLKDISISIPWEETQTYLDKLKSLNFDIGIVVAEDNMFNRCKSNLKLIEYGLTKVAPIAHSTYPYQNTIRHIQTGFLIENPKTEWKKYLELLIENEELRTSIQFKSNDTIRKMYTFEQNGQMILDKYNEIFTRLGF